jgi:plastocyanin
MKKTLLIPGQTRSWALVYGISGLIAVIGVGMLTLAVAEPAFAKDDNVSIDNFTFSPEQVTVDAGTKVTWVNHDDIPHVVVSTTKAFKSPVLDTDNQFSYTFSEPGTYKYFCALHPHMVGTIVVTRKVSANGMPK